jgi:alpha-galactosidase
MGMRLRCVRMLTAACLCLASLVALAPRAAAETNGLALAPPMGWNDWYSDFCGVSAQLVEQTAQDMVSDGMKAAGYRYVNIDDCWMAPSRDGAGNLVADPTRFPGGIKPVADYVHSLGLKLGIYADAGTSTCAHLPGSYGHETQDAETFASWGVDYVKYDRCNIPYGAFPGATEQEVDQTLFARMSNALKATHRQIVFSVVAPDPGVNSWDWAAPVANLWRTTPDSEDNYGSVLANFEGTVELYRHAGPGAWNDPDLLQIGNGGSSLLEYQTEFSLWAEMSAPLIASTNVADLTPAELAIYENRNVIAVDQDPLGRPGVPISSAGGLWVLSKRLTDGDRAVLLFNSNNTAATVSTSATAVGLRKAAGYSLINLWSNAVTETGGGISAFVPGHGVAMFRVSPAPRPELARLPSHMVLSLTPAQSEIAAGATTTVRETFADQGAFAIKRLKLSFSAPAGWRVTQDGLTHTKRLGAGRQFSVLYSVTAPPTGPPISLAALTGKAAYDPDVGLGVSSATLAEQVSVPVGAPFGTANVTGQSAWFGASDVDLAINAAGTGVFPSYEQAGPTDSYAAIYESAAATPSSYAQVLVTSDPAGGTAGGAGLIERGAMNAPGGSPPAVVLYVSSDNTIEMAWNAAGSGYVDSWYQVPGIFAPPPVLLRLVRSGSTYTGYYSTDHGTTWKTVASVAVSPLASAGAQDVGIFHASGLTSWQTTATFESLLVVGG